MANHRQTKELHTTESAIREQQANIARLETTPSKEEVDLAVQQLETASLTYKYSAARADRKKTLYERGSISFDAYDDAAEKKEVDRQLVSERQANLLATKNQVNPNEIDAAKAEEQRLQEELVYYEEQLRRTSLRMPINGRIITMSLKNLENKYLEEGLLFAEVEDAHEVRVTISIPESDIGEVSVGDEVRLKLWTYPDRIFVSTVKEIWPATSEAEYGTVVVVESILSNDEKLLRSGMTGHAKVQGSEMFVIQAFTRALVRFVLIEVWSWLP
jgi:putative peptide zinc metalloprotease protein